MMFFTDFTLRWIVLFLTTYIIVLYRIRDIEKIEPFKPTTITLYLKNNVFKIPSEQIDILGVYFVQDTIIIGGGRFERI